MSWSIVEAGKAKSLLPLVRTRVAAIQLSDAGEMETVKHVGALIEQTLGTFDPEKPVKVSASGSMSFRDWTAKTGGFQSVSIAIEPIHFTTPD